MFDTRIELIVPAKPFSSEEALVEHLLTEDQSGKDNFLYRGQAREHRRRYPLTQGPFRDLSESDLVNVDCWSFHPASLGLPIELTRGLMDLPSLIPTNTRRYEQYLQHQTTHDHTTHHQTTHDQTTQIQGTPGESTDWEEDAFDDMMVYFWTTVCNFLVGLACRLSKEADGLRWLETQWESDYPALYKLRSLGQHYGMDTGLLDATSSIPVALWFATHDFRTGLYRGKDSATLYRVNRQGLQEAEDWLRKLPEHEGEFDAATIDIRDTPASIAARASRQQGWSLVGWDHPRLIIQMAAEGFLTRYDFPTGLAPSGANGMTRDYLVPADDLMSRLFERFWARQPRSLSDAQSWIDNHWNIAASERIVLDEDGSWLDQLSSEIGRIYDFHVRNLPPGLSPSIRT